MRDLVDEEGENRALRTFLMQYGLPGLTVSAMAQHMNRSGWDHRYWPEFARKVDNATQHLTKAGAQIWIRHLLSLERTPVSAPTAAERQSIGEDREFHRLLAECVDASRLDGTNDPADTLFALIAHIDTWAARSAGYVFELAARACEERALHWQQMDGPYNAGKKAGALDAADAIRQLAPAPGNTAQPLDAEQQTSAQFSALRKGG